MQWTPNGEAPAPYSTKARQQMGMDPQAMAGMMGQAGGAAPPAAVPGATMKFNLAALVVMYLTNNWKLVIALQEIVMKLLKPFLDMYNAQQVAKEKAAAAAATAAAREARLRRLSAAKATEGGGGGGAAAEDEDEEE